MAHTISYSDFEDTTHELILASSVGVNANKKLTLVTEFGDDVSHYYEVSSPDDEYTTLDFNMAINYYNKI